MNKVIVLILFICYYVALGVIAPNLDIFVLVYSIAASIGILIFSIIFIAKKHYYFAVTLFLSLFHISIIAYGMIRELYG